MSHLFRHLGLEGVVVRPPRGRMPIPKEERRPCVREGTWLLRECRDFVGRMGGWGALEGALDAKARPEEVDGELGRMYEVILSLTPWQRRKLRGFVRAAHGSVRIAVGFGKAPERLHEEPMLKEVEG